MIFRHDSVNQITLGSLATKSALISQLTEINEKIVDPSKLKLTVENFLNPLNSLDLQMRAADMLKMDLLAREIFLNLEIYQQKRSFTNIKNRFKL